MTLSRRGPQPFDSDAEHHQGYRYTTTAPLSAIVANQRLTDVTVAWLKQLKKITTVMDLGCGDGTYTAELAVACPKLKFKGCDPASTAIKIARQKYRRIPFSVADLLRLKTLPKPATDVSVVRGVIHHVPIAEQGVINAVQYSGQTLIIEPNGWNPILKVIEKVSPYHRAHGERSFTSRQLQQWVEAGDARVLKTYFVGLVPFFCPSQLVKPLKVLEPYIERSWLAPLVCAQAVLEIKRNY